MQNDFSKLGPIGQSVISEMANIGLGNATTSLASLTGHSFEMGVPEATSVPLEQLPLMFGDSDDAYVGIYMPVEGESQGHMGFFLSWDSAQILWKMLLGDAPKDAESITELDSSALIEVGNIINGAFLRAISEFSNVNMIACPPLMSVDMMSSMLSSIATEACGQDHMALSIKTEIFDANRSFEGFFIMIPTVEGIRLIFKNLGVLEAA